MLMKLQEKLEFVLTSPDMAQRRPAVKKNNESNSRRLNIIGDRAGAPMIKLAMAQGYEVIEHIVKRSSRRTASRARSIMFW